MTGKALEQKLSPWGKTAAQWADVLGVSENTIYRLFRSSNVRTATVERLSKATGKPVIWFYGLEGDTQRNAETTTDSTAATTTQAESLPQPHPIEPPYNIREKVTALLKEKRKKTSELCRHIGMTEMGVKRMLANNTCTNTTIIRMADFFGVPFTHLLPYDRLAAEEEEREKQIQYLKGQLDVYRKAIATLLSKTATDRRSGNCKSYSSLH